MEYFDKTVQVEFSINELVLIHNLINNKINTVNNVYKANELMGIASKIEDVTSEYIVYYED